MEESISKMLTNANVENVYRIIRNRNKLRFTQKWVKVTSVPSSTVVLGKTRVQEIRTSYNLSFGQIQANWQSKIVPLTCQNLTFKNANVKAGCWEMLRLKAIAMDDIINI